MARAFSGALVPAVGADGSVQWQGWQYEELLAHLNNDLQIGGDSIDAVALGRALTVSTWIIPSPLAGTWVNTGGGFAVVGYLKDALGWVHLKGLVQGGVNGTAVFTLPLGFRPAEIHFYPAALGSLAAGGAVEVQPNGAVLAWAGASNVGLEIPPFLAEL